MQRKERKQIFDVSCKALGVVFDVSEAASGKLLVKTRTSEFKSCALTSLALYLMASSWVSKQEAYRAGCSSLIRRFLAESAEGAHGFFQSVLTSINMFWVTMTNFT